MKRFKGVIFVERVRVGARARVKGGSRIIATNKHAPDNRNEAETEKDRIFERIMEFVSHRVTRYAIWRKNYR